MNNNTSNSTLTHNTHQLQRQEKWIYMTIKEVKKLYWYYLLLLILSSLFISFSILYHFEFSENGFSVFWGIFMFAFPSGLLGATIYYIRKLYKSCIQNLVTPPTNDEGTTYRKIGAKAYFYFRPIISGILSSLINIGLLCGFYLINNYTEVDNKKYFLFIIVLSFYIGFCNGKIIIKIEEQSKDFANIIFKENKNE